MKIFPAIAGISVVTVSTLVFAAPESDLGLEDLTKTDISSVSERNQSLSKVPGRYVGEISKPEFPQRTRSVFVHDNGTLIADSLQRSFGARWEHTNLGGKTFSPNAISPC